LSMRAISLLLVPFARTQRTSNSRAERGMGRDLFASSAFSGSTSGRSFRFGARRFLHPVLEGSGSVRIDVDGHGRDPISFGIIDWVECLFSQRR
jgi:hypothetical protein